MGGRSPHMVSMVCKAGSFTPPVTVTTPVTTPAVKSLVKTELCSYFQNLGESLAKVATEHPAVKGC